MDIERILKEMTLEDKIALCSGASFWETKRFERYGIPALFMCDGPTVCESRRMRRICWA